MAFGCDGRSCSAADKHVQTLALARSCVSLFTEVKRSNLCSRTLVYEQISDVPISLSSQVVKWEELFQYSSLLVTHSWSSSSGWISKQKQKHQKDIKMHLSTKTCSHRAEHPEMRAMRLLLKFTPVYQPDCSSVVRCLCFMNVMLQRGEREPEPEPESLLSAVLNSDTHWHTLSSGCCLLIYS